jgi:Fur family iron response transcriptional regulator
MGQQFTPPFGENSAAGDADTPASEGAGSDFVASDRIAELLRAKGVPLTLQRLAVAQILFLRPVHMTADQIHARAQAIMPEISRATVYNTLKLFRDKGLLRELVVDPARIVYDSNTSPHYHLYNTDTGEMTDVPAGHLQVIGTTLLPAGVELDELDIIIRVRNKSA